MTYQERIKGYEKEKQELLRSVSSIPVWKLEEMLKALADKWRV